MKYCPKCGAENVDDAAFCEKCGASFSNPTPKSYDDEEGADLASTGSTHGMHVVSILALVFGILGGWAGLVLAIIGLANPDTVGTDRTYCKIGLGFFIGWVILIIVLACLRAFYKA